MDIRVNPFLFRFPLCQHVLFAHQTAEEQSKDESGKMKVIPLS
jgi:hypothetical protein